MTLRAASSMQQRQPWHSVEAYHSRKLSHPGVMRTYKHLTVLVQVCTPSLPHRKCYHACRAVDALLRLFRYSTFCAVLVPGCPAGWGSHRVHGMHCWRPGALVRSRGGAVAGSRGGSRGSRQRRQQRAQLVPGGGPLGGRTGCRRAPSPAHSRPAAVRAPPHLRAFIPQLAPQGGRRTAPAPAAEAGRGRTARWRPGSSWSTATG